MKSILLIIILISTERLSVINATDDDSEEEFLPLPNHVKPIRYTLTIETNLKVQDSSSSFNGSVIIELESFQLANNITLNVRDLNINNNTIRVIDSTGAELRISNTEYDTKEELFIIYLVEYLLENQSYTLIIEEFSGIMKYDNVGFYLAKYIKEDGTERHIGVTDFEARDARKAFPCFDDPSMKATFLINIIRPADYFSLSNAELEFTKDLGNGRFMDIFKETKIMPTYIVAYLVSDFKHTQKIERHRIFAKAAAIEAGKLDYALNVAVEVLTYLEEYTGMNYTNTKMDQVAIPDRYYQDEAMENWGLVTFSEKHLFISNDTSPIDDVEKTISYISHEFAHQWFGNLVTFKNWKYLWLSEGFGAFFQFYLTSLLRPSWRMMERYVATVLYGVLEFDSSSSTQTINFNKPLPKGSIPSPWICYYKASAIIRMAQHFLSPEIFRQGLQIYLKENQFKNAEPQDLYAAFQAAVDENDLQYILGNNSVASIMASWDTNEGLPLITAKRDYESKKITLSQERYSEEEVETKGGSIWYVPINFANQLSSHTNYSDTKADVWLTEKELTVDDDFASDGWFLLNKQQTGFYRINYDLTNWERLILFLNREDYKSIHVVNRGQIIDDAFHLARYGIVPYHVPLNISKYLVNETDYVPIVAFTNALPHLTFVMSSSKLYDVYKTFVINSLSTAYDYLEFNEKPTDTHLDKFTRVLVIKWLCKFGHSECRNNALKKIREWKRTGTLSVSPNLKHIVLCNSMRLAETSDWEFLYEKAVNESKTRYNEYYGALTCSENESILIQYLNRLLNNSFLLNGSGRRIFRSMIIASDVGLKTGMDFIKNADLPERIRSIFAFDISERCTTDEQLTDFGVFNNTIKKETFGYAIETVSYNIQLIKDSFIHDLEHWLQEYNDEYIENSNVVR